MNLHKKGVADELIIDWEKETIPRCFCLWTVNKIRIFIWTIFSKFTTCQKQRIVINNPSKQQTKSCFCFSSCFNYEVNRLQNIAFQSSSDTLKKYEQEQQAKKHCSRRRIKDYCSVEKYCDSMNRNIFVQQSYLSTSENHTDIQAS